MRWGWSNVSDEVELGNFGQQFSESRPLRLYTTANSSISLVCLPAVSIISSSTLYVFRYSGFFSQQAFVHSKAGISFPGRMRVILTESHPIAKAVAKFAMQKTGPMPSD
jgi:hypothetical protein